MIPSSYPFWLNAIAFLSVTVPIVLVILIYNMSRFTVWKYILCGFGAYFLTDRILAPFFYAFTESMVLGIDADNTVFFRFVAPLFYGTFEFLAFFILEKFILKKNLKVTEACALPVLFYLFPFIEGAISYPSLARCAKAFNNGTLQELVTASLSLSDLNEYVELMKSSSFWPTIFCQLLNRLTIMLVIGVSVILIYHGIMKQKPINYLFAYLVIVGNYELISLIEHFGGLTALLVFFLIELACLVFFFIKYFIWYFRQKKDFQQKLADYKQHLKRQ